jgi:hypothetical protein
VQRGFGPPQRIGSPLCYLAQVIRAIVWTVAGLIIGLIADAWFQRHHPLIQLDWTVIRVTAGGLFGMLAAMLTSHFSRRVRP